MKPLLKIMLCLMLVFAVTFLILNLTGLLTVEQIRSWLVSAQQATPWYVFCIVILLLFADLFISVPGLPLILTAGFLIGPVLASIASIIGFTLAGTAGYFLSAKYGEKIVRTIVKDASQRKDAMETFREHGAIVILLSRALPMLPEVSACMAGLTQMPFSKFMLTWLLSIVPYCIIISYAGSISTIDDPTPAIIAYISIVSVLWLGWFLFQHLKKSKL